MDVLAAFPGKGTAGATVCNPLVQGTAIIKIQREKHRVRREPAQGVWS
jgi:hypothetical protein